MSINIKTDNEAEKIILASIKQREHIEKHTFHEIIKNYQTLIKKLYDSQGKTDGLRQSLLSNFGGRLDGNINNSEKLHQLNDELREAYKKLSESKEAYVELKEKWSELEKLKEDHKRLSVIKDQMKESLEVKSKQNNELTSENKLLSLKVKELSQDNALYYK